jgi:hypothetical protein
VTPNTQLIPRRGDLSRYKGLPLRTLRSERLFDAVHEVNDSQDVAIDTFAPRCKHLGEFENGGTDDLA